MSKNSWVSDAKACERITIYLIRKLVSFSILCLSTIYVKACEKITIYLIRNLSLLFNHTSVLTIWRFSVRERGLYWFEISIMLSISAIP